MGSFYTCRMNPPCCIWLKGGEDREKVVRAYKMVEHRLASGGRISDRFKVLSGFRHRVDFPDGRKFRYETKMLVRTNSRRRDAASRGGPPVASP